MSPWYNALKFIHVSAVIVWVGGVVAVTFLTSRLAREGDGPSLRVLGSQSEFFGKKIQGPAVGVALLAGLALMGMLKTMAFWMTWGLVALVVSMALDGAVVRRATRELGALADAPAPDERRIAALRGRLRLGAILNIVILTATVWVMVAKPTLK